MALHHRRTPADQPPAAPPEPDQHDSAPQPASPQELDDARTVLVIHRLDPQAGRCAACAADCPCPPALDAGRTLAQAGAWNTMPFTSPVGWRADPGPTQTPTDGGWLARLVRHLP